MTERRWRLYRHKNNPKIEYYVEEYPAFIRSTDEVAEWNPFLYKTNKYADQERWGNVNHVRIRCPRNAAHPQFDYPSVEQMPPGGLWPAQCFLDLYEPVPINARDEYQRATLIDEWPDKDWTNIESPSI